MCRRCALAGAWTAEGPEVSRHRRAPRAQFAMHLGDYKKVDGIMLPHKIDISIEGQPNEEWTIQKFKVNPSVKAGRVQQAKE